MALWNGLGQVATVAQLTGVDAGGLISMILQAVLAVKRNREECRHLARRAMMVGDLLQELQGRDMMQDHVIRRPLDGLDDALREAYVLINSCQDCSVVYRFIMGWKQAEQFRQVQMKIDGYIQLYPFIGHIDITRRLDKLLCNSSHPLSSRIQVSGEILEPCMNQSNSDTRTGEDGGGIEIEQTEKCQSEGIVEQNRRSVQGDVMHYISQEQQLPGYRERSGTSPVRKSMLMWCCWLIKDMTSVPNFPWFTYRHGIGIPVYRLSVLKAATNNFSSENLIGCGGFSTVYKGRLQGGPVVAIKRFVTFGYISDRKYMCRSFEAEIGLLLTLQHVNIVRLLGYCIEQGEMILVCEYIPNGSLQEYIFGTRVPLSWSLRFRIINGMAQGIVYLHEYSRCRILHGDLKPSNILLDDQMNPKIIDFGIAQLIRGSKMDAYGIRGTIGYVDPEYIMTGKCSSASDVYALGVILLEIVTAKRSISSLNDSPLHAGLDHAWKMWRAGRLVELIDPSLQDEPRVAEILRCIQIALLCVEPRREDRPTMPEVIVMLGSDSATLPHPKRRGFEDAPVIFPCSSAEQTQSGAMDSAAQ